MKRLLSTITTIFLGCSVIAQTGTISNINVIQRPNGTGMFDIYFDLSGQNISYNILLEVIFDGDADYTSIPRTNLKGDLEGILPGEKKHIEWDGLATFPDKYSIKTKVKILVKTISDGDLGTVTDIDGNAYNTVSIGTQVWMVENLKSTKYSDGTAIPNVTDGTTWNNVTTPGYCWYDNDVATYKSLYGALYNWYAVSAADNGGKNVCPTGWHVPEDAEWNGLITYLGGESIAGGKLKDTGTDHWQSPNTGATDEFGFTALPGGFCKESYGYIGLSGHWWTSTEGSSSTAIYQGIGYVGTEVVRYDENKSYGLSVRCLKGASKIPFNDEFYNLNDNLVPSGWEFIVPSPEVVIENGRLNAYPIDAYGYLRRQGTVPTGVTKLNMEWDGNLSPTYWGMTNLLTIQLNNNSYFNVYLQTAEAWGINNNKLFFWHCSENNQQKLGEWIVPLKYGEFHYKVTIDNNVIGFTCSDIASSTSYVDQVINIPSNLLFNLQKIKSVDYGVNCTTETSNWLDNISIALIR